MSADTKKALAIEDTKKALAIEDTKKALAIEECQKKIADVRAAISPLPEKLSRFASDESIARYLRARNWNVKKSTKMLKESLKWRSEYKPDDLCWENVVSEAESGKVYRSASVDKKGRPVLVMRPACQNSKSVGGQIKYVVYCMENAILNMPPNQEQMVWLVDFWNFSLSNVSFKSAKETAHVLQNHYPERLGVAIMYNPPRIFEQFYSVVKPFLEQKTRNKVKFVYADDPNSKKIMEELFDMDQLESAFGGNSSENFEFQKYAQRMKGDDERKRASWAAGLDPFASTSSNGLTKVISSSDNDDPSDEEETDDRSASLTPARDTIDSPQRVQR